MHGMTNGRQTWREWLRNKMRPSHLSDRLHHLEQDMDELSEKLANTEAKVSNGLSHVEEKIEPLREILVRVMRQETD